jgi:hypothetical protein
MGFQGTPTDMTTLLIVALALASIFFILRQKYDSNLPLLFYFVAVMFSNMTEESVNPYLLYTGLGFALLLRFEFMNRGFAKVVAYFATGSTLLVIWNFLADIFGDNFQLF